MPFESDFRSWAVSGFDLGNFESVLEAVGVLTTIVVVHEGGHFLAAYLQGIHVSKFAVGFGPILAKFNAMNVEYSIRAFPLGGFVGFPDNDPESDIPVDDENLLKNRPILDRTILVCRCKRPFLGCLFLKFEPFLLLPEMVASALANGTKLPKTGPNAVSEVVDVIKSSPNKNVLLKVERGEQNFEIGVIPDESFDGAGKIGVQLAINVKITRVIAKNIFEAFNFAGEEFWGLSSKVVDSLKQTFSNFSQSASKVSGPVAIIAVGAEVARSNIDGLYQFAAVLNINLAVINLLPLPALDGGSLALILIEAARGGRKLPLEIEQRIMSSGIMLVSILGLFLIVRDTLNLDFIKDMM
uniref:Peptidase M50 domain-containing protein n=1 Tax=Salix viminalis TaxID=40686 RepID=A0A6N2MCN6_SALVM